MTELIWDGKYDKSSKKNGPVRIALPFQTIETVNESAQEREKTLDLFAQGRPTKWRNRLIWGDKKYVLPSLLPEFAGKINLVYIDPPFFTGTDQIYAININVHNSEELITKEPSLVEEAAYRNIWRSGSDSFMSWIYDTLIILRELLNECGIIFIRFDQYWSHYVKLIADEVFGKNNFQNEIVVKRIHKNVTNQGKISIPLATDSLFVYFKTMSATYKNIYKKLKETRPSYWRAMDSPGIRPNPTRTIEGKVFTPPHGRHFTFTQERVDKMYKEGRVRINPKTHKLQYLVKEAENVVLNSNWTDISGYSFTTGYPTENSESLLERVIKASTNENDLVFDCFGGSGTTAATAERMNRRWITCDIGRYSIHTIRKRLLEISNVKPFVVQNLGKYERQQWMGAEFHDVSERAAKEQRYRLFILHLYHAEQLTGYVWLHGSKAGRMIHVGSIDAPVSIGDVKNIVQEFWKSVGKSEDIQINGVDVLGWDFAFEINETAKQFAAANNVDLKFKKIPREVLEKKAVEQGDIRFFELASLEVNIKVETQKVTIILSDFIVPPDDVPEDVQANIMHWEQWIDYWAIDWNFRNDTFHNEWQSYRTKKEPGISLETSCVYKDKGKYQIVIKVIDILGNDTTKMIEVEV